MPSALLLASTSRYRAELLQRLGYPFEAVDPALDEPLLAGESPAVRAQRLALAKARSVASIRPDALVIGSDQVCALGNQVLRKPGNAQANRTQLAALSGQTAVFHTAVALVGMRQGICMQHRDATRCVFRTLSSDEIADYVAAEQAFDCAGGFKSEGRGIGLFERIESQDPTALIGLPLIWLAAALRRAP